MIYPINHLPDKIPIGIQTEQGVEVIGFDLKPWLDVFPDMAFAVWHTRPGETEAYPVNDHMMVGTVLYWHPDGYDTAIAGEGKVEIAGVGENRRKLSGFAPTAIQATSLGATKEPGESVSPWYEAILQAAQDVKANVDAGSGGLYLVNTKDSRADRTQEEIRAAVAAGKTCLLVVHGKVYMYQQESKHPLGEVAPMFVSPLEYGGNKGVYRYRCAYVLADGYVATLFSDLSVPNPTKLTIGGVEYDGSKAVSVDIPEVYVVTISNVGSGVWVADRTYAEIGKAYGEGKACFVRTSAGETFPMTEAGNNKYSFEICVFNSYLFKYVRNSVEIKSDNTVVRGTSDVFAYPMAPLGSTKTSYLRFNGSKWEPATIDQLKSDLGL